MQVYFSHSYRDVPINSYFSDLFTQAGITLNADQKTEVWCMAKLERYMFELSGFASIITRRFAPDGSLTYSPYIGRELMLARRARTPQVLFVDDQILNQYRQTFPSYAVPFFHGDPGRELSRHIDTISQFRRTLATGGARPPRKYQEQTATVVSGQGPILRDAASHIAAILRSEGYNPDVKSAATDLDQAFDDIDDFESLLGCELSVFVLDRELSCSDVLLAIAHAHCIPTVRLRYDPDAQSTEPELSGVVRWNGEGDLAPAFLHLFRNYQSVFANPTEKGDFQKLAIPQPPASSLNQWNPSDGPGLVVFVLPEDSFVTDRAASFRGLQITAAKTREQSDILCRALYNRIREDRFYYTYEPVLAKPVGQRIRLPQEIGALNCGTCLDFACLFASLLEASHEKPALIIVDTANAAHAVSAYRTEGSVLPDSPSLGDLRGAIARGEIVPFETTGAVEARNGVIGAETPEQRVEGHFMLDYQTAKLAARNLLLREDIRLRHFVDVRKVRQGTRS